LKVLVVDLDGTLIKVNSFHKWFFFLAKKLTREVRFYKLISLFYATVLRAMKLHTHSQWKRNVMLISSDLEEKCFLSFSENLIKERNNIEPYIRGEFGLRILATAAPEFYSKHVASLFGFDVCLATGSPITEVNWKENIRAEKRFKVQDYLKSQNYSGNIDTLITDHKDDLPLMRISENVLLVNPDRNTVIAVDGERLNWTKLIM